MRKDARPVQSRASLHLLYEKVFKQFLDLSFQMASERRVLIDEWFPTGEVGVESVRERSVGQNPPINRLHVWFARRPLVASRAAVLASILPPDTTRE